ncbi:MAG: hypothetical protein KatS3mg068_1519 [Candidatus Sericytochromatia bacterium]|nr:MAG: hypothetical protein KatS3mg068_1519 [Candidatus Sericytochromatia bacterium]
MKVALDRINSERFSNFNNYNTSLSKDDVLKLSYFVLSRFNINYLSMSSINAFENRFYEWVIKYIVGKKLPFSIKMLRGSILEKYLLNKIVEYNDVEKMKEDAVIDFMDEVKKNNEDDNLLPYEESDLESVKDFIVNTIHLNFDFFKQKDFFEQGLNVKYSLNGSINVYGVVDSLIKIKDTIGCVELKSTERIPKEPNENHIKQLAFYLLTTDLPVGYIYYIGSSKYMRKGSTYLRIFAFKRENLENYIKEYLEKIIYKMTKFLMKFNSPDEIIDITIPQYTSFFLDEHLRDVYGNTFDFKFDKIEPDSSYELSV